jgi:hypothetical protein
MAELFKLLFASRQFVREQLRATTSPVASTGFLMAVTDILISIEPQTKVVRVTVHGWSLSPPPLASCHDDDDCQEQEQEEEAALCFGDILSLNMK